VIVISGTLPSLLRFSANGARLAYSHTSQGKLLTYVADGGTNTPRVFCENCSLQAFFSHAEEALAGYGNRLVRQDLSTGARVTLLEVPGSGPWHASLSPDDRSLAFTVPRPDGTAVLYVTRAGSNPLPPGQWVQVDAGRYHLETPQWSSDGRTLYYGSNRDGFACVWARRIDANGKPFGAPFAAYHWHDSGILKTAGRVLFGITPERLYLLDWEVKGNIWSINLRR
jgi:Tol biopolymer transport system component